MPRKRVVQKILEALEDYSDEPGHYILIYTGTDPHLYKFVEELFQALEDGCRLAPRCVIETTMRKTARAVDMLLSQYGIAVKTYRISEVIDWS